jgi:hypothetical protein
MGYSLSVVDLESSIELRKMSLAGSLFLFVSLFCWLLSSPIGSGPDEGWHVGSAYCAWGENSDCRFFTDSTIIYDSDSPDTKLSAVLGDQIVPLENRSGQLLPTTNIAEVPWTMEECFRWDPKKSALCGSISDQPRTQINPSDAVGYPNGYYKFLNVVGLFDGSTNILFYRLINIALFSILFFYFLSTSNHYERVYVLSTLSLTMIPLGLFILSSINPSGWSFTGLTFSWIFMSRIPRLSQQRFHQTSNIFALLTSIFMAVESRYDNRIILLVVGLISFVAFDMEFRKQLIGETWRKFVVYSLGVLLVAFALLKVPILTRNYFSVNESSISISTWISHWIVRLPEVPIQVFGTGGLGWLDTFVPFVVPAIGLSLFVSAFLFSFINYDRKQILVVISTVLFLASVILSQAFEYRSLMNNNIQGRYVLSLVTFLLGISIYVSRSPIQLFEIKALRHFAILAISFIHMLSLFVNTQRYVNGVSQSFSPMILTDTSWWWPNSPIGPNFLVILGSLSFFLFLRCIWSTVPLKSLDSLKF